MSLKIRLGILALFFTSLAYTQNLVDFVNPFIGTANNANTNPGAVLPWGMMSISPSNTYDPVSGKGSSSPYCVCLSVITL